jgi:hypothetical protein
MPRIIPAPGGGGSTFGIDNAQAGLWVPAGAPFVTPSSFVGSATRAYFCRFVCPRSLAVSKVSFSVAAVATANDACDAGIYAADCSTLLGSAGSTSGKLNAAVGVQTLNLLSPIGLIAGQVYYAAFAYGTFGGTGASLVWAGVLPGSMPLAFGSVPPAPEIALSQPHFPLATAPVLNLTNVAVPILALQT